MLKTVKRSNLELLSSTFWGTLFPILLLTVTLNSLYLFGKYFKHSEVLGTKESFKRT
jgi:ABC-type dipeptide/oligopeptide/nickel transport system permease subunit